MSGAAMPSEMTDLLQRAAKALEHDLCDHCLGRAFAQLGTGMTNHTRGTALRTVINMARAEDGLEPIEHHECWVCEDIFDSVPRFAEAIVEKLSAIEHDNFLVGSRVDPEISEREERLWSEVGSETSETIKAELNREIGKAVWALIGKDVEFTSPEVVAVIDTRFADVELDIAPVFVHGRYRKLVRDIPQTKWPCRRCQGKGCERCGNTGKMYPTSVQEIIGDVALEVFGGKEHLFHGMGREDIDALMLGTGRPFVLEIRDPVRRSFDLVKLMDMMNEAGKERVEVTRLRPSDRKEVRTIKEATPNKEYRVTVSADGKVNKQKLNEVAKSFKNHPIAQRTPARVSHRRADLVRDREIVRVDVEDAWDEGFVLVLETESGTYVKEFVSGDEGRTEPSLAESLGIPCKVVTLDVIAIHDHDNCEE
jgi:tRNA pseudouridine synthase 10